MGTKEKKRKEKKRSCLQQQQQQQQQRRRRRRRRLTQVARLDDSRSRVERTIESRLLPSLPAPLFKKSSASNFFFFFFFFFFFLLLSTDELMMTGRSSAHNLTKTKTTYCILPNSLTPSLAHSINVQSLTTLLNISNHQRSDSCSSSPNFGPGLVTIVIAIAIYNETTYQATIKWHLYMCRLQLDRYSKYTPSLYCESKKSGQLE